MSDLKFSAVDISKFASDINEAFEDARLHARAVEDGGSCNHDTVVVNFDRKGSRQRTQELQSLLRNGIEASWFKFRNSSSSLELSATSLGQGARQTVFAKRVAKTLKERGWPAVVFYVLD